MRSRLDQLTTLRVRSDGAGLWRGFAEHKQRIDSGVEPHQAAPWAFARMNAPPRVMPVSMQGGMALVRQLQHQQRINTHIEPIHPPMQMRPGRTPGRTDSGEHLALFDAIAHVHVDAR